MLLEIEILIKVRKGNQKNLTWYSHGSILGIISKTTMSMRNNQMQKQDTNSKNKQQKKNWVRVKQQLL